MSTKRKLRFPMFFKFLVACLALAGLLIFGGAMLVQKETQFRNRGNFLAKHFARYTFYQDRTGRDMTGATEILAGDTGLRAAIASDATGGPEAAGAVEAIAKPMHDRIVKSENGLKPDLFLVFNTNGRLLWAPKDSPVDPERMSSIAAVEKARGGTPFAHRIQIIGDVPYQVSALPIRALTGDDVIGGIAIGRKLQRMFDEYATQTDENADLRYRPALVDGTTVLASAMPGEKSAFVKASQAPVRVTVGADTREVIRMKDADYDFYVEDVDGYKGADPATIGKLYLARGRSQVVDPAKKLPWLEIAVGTGASIVIALLLGFWITRPIKQFVRQSRDLLQGDTDLTQRIVVNSRDETADLADNINQVFARLHILANDVQSAAFHVGASSAEISAASKQMLGGLKDQTLKIEGSTTAVTELSASIQQVASNAAQATEVAEQSNTAVVSAVDRMTQIRSSVEDAASKMRDLGESSKRIGNIVEVIRQISEQTSMLALNASIEAAHAGEQGRGFAVVADEVSSLARRVGQSAKDIEALIQTVKEQTQAAIASMESGRRDVENGAALVTTTLTGLGQLITVVKDTAVAVHEQAVVSDEIARNMDAVRTIAGEVLSGSEESVVQAQRLHELAFQLEESIGGFNLDGHKIGGDRPRERDGDRDRDGRGGKRRELPAGPGARARIAGKGNGGADRAADAGGRD
jgi:methyl-accepting chemotaxis protein